jgi:hypothetical protein
MIKEGHTKRIKYWGKYKVKKVVQLKQPVTCHSEEIGEAEFMPTIVKLEWEKPPSSDKNEFWFPYWLKVRGKWKYGQFAPMIGEDALLQLLKEAIEQDYFSRQFLMRLTESIKGILDESP